MPAPDSDEMGQHPEGAAVGIDEAAMLPQPLRHQQPLPRYPPPQTILRHPFQHPFSQSMAQHLLPQHQHPLPEPPFHPSEDPTPYGSPVRIFQNPHDTTQPEAMLQLHALPRPQEQPQEQPQSQTCPPHPQSAVSSPLGSRGVSPTDLAEAGSSAQPSNPIISQACMAVASAPAPETPFVMAAATASVAPAPSAAPASPLAQAMSSAPVAAALGTVPLDPSSAVCAEVIPMAPGTATPVASPVIRARFAHPRGHDPRVRNLRMQVLQQERQIQEQQVRTQMLTQMLEQQHLINEEQVRMNQHILSASNRVMLGTREGAYEDIQDVSPGLRVAPAESEGTTVAVGTTSDAGTDAQSKCPKMASLPVCASSIIFTLHRNKLLPRTEEVQEVTDSLLERHLSHKISNRSEGADLELVSHGNGHTDSTPYNEAADPDNCASAERDSCDEYQGCNDDEDCVSDYDDDGCSQYSEGYEEHTEYDVSERSEEYRENVSLSEPKSESDSSVSPSQATWDSTGSFDPTKYCTVIAGMGGIGKTTLAAMVVSSDSILSHFHDGIGWIKLGLGRGSDPGAGHKKSEEWSVPRSSSWRLPYADYIYHLRILCRQLGVPAPEFEDLVFLSGDDSSNRERKALHAMEDARQVMTNTLNGKSVLLVLDDLWYHDDLEWFQFANRPQSRCRTLVTTRMHLTPTGGRSLLSRSPTLAAGEMDGPGVRQVWSGGVINLGSLKEEEAVQMLMKEARGPFLASLGRTHLWSAEDKEHALSIVRACGCIPVAVRSAGKLLSEASTDAGGFRLDDLALSLSYCGMHKGPNLGLSGNMATPALGSVHGNPALYEILGRSFSPELYGNVLARSLEICFAAFAAVFARTDCARPFVPITTIHMLFEGILLKEERLALQTDPGMSYTMQLLDKMEGMGLVDSAVKTIPLQRLRQDGTVVTKPTLALYYRVHHDVMLQYALHSLRNDSILSHRELTHRLRKNKLTPLLTSKKVPSILRWQRTKNKDHECRKLIKKLNWLVAHKIEKKRNEQPHRPWDLAISSDGYVFQQLPIHLINAGGSATWRRVLLLLQDHGFIRGRMILMGVEDTVKAHCGDIEAASCLSARDQKSNHDKNDMLSAYNALYTYLKEHLPTDGTVPPPEELGKPSIEEIAAGLVAIGASLQKQSLWVEALDKLAEALKVYKMAGLADDHPGIVRANLFVQASSLPMLCLVPRGSPKCVRLKYASKLRRHEGDRLAISEGTDITGRIGIPLELSSHEGLAIVVRRPQFGKQFGITFQPLSVGPKDSAVRVFVKGKHICRSSDGAQLTCPTFQVKSIGLTPASMKRKDFWKDEICVEFKVNEDGSISPLARPDLACGIGDFPLLLVSRDSPSRCILKHGNELRKNQQKKVGHTPSNVNGYSFELLSHPGWSIKPMNELCDIGPLHVKILTVGPAEDVLEGSYDGRLIASSKDGSVMRVVGRIGALYDVSNPVFMFRGNSRSTACRAGGLNDFVINEDGSISPKHAPNVAVGCACLGLANELVTEEERIQTYRRLQLDLRQSAHLTNSVFCRWPFLKKFSAV